MFSDQVTVSLRRLSMNERNESEAPRLLPTFPIALQRKFRETMSAIQRGHWDVVLQTIHFNPELLTAQSSVSGGQTLLHIALSQNIFLPEKVVVNMLKLCPRIIYATDANHCHALHYAASNGQHVDLIPLFLERWKDGASKANMDGNSPLHLAAFHGRR